jgi:hypothetical protein
MMRQQHEALIPLLVSQMSSPQKSNVVDEPVRRLHQIQRNNRENINIPRVYCDSV